MADLSWPGDVLIIAGLATVGFTLVSFWFSGLMTRRNWTFQIRSKPKRRQAPTLDDSASR